MTRAAGIPNHPGKAFTRATGHSVGRYSADEDVEGQTGAAGSNRFMRAHMHAAARKHLAAVGQPARIKNLTWSIRMQNLRTTHRQVAGSLRDPLEGGK